MSIDPITIDDVPLTLLRGDGADSSASRACLLCYHGFTSSTAAWLHDLDRFVQAGFTVAGVDAVGHGRRRNPEFDRRFADPADRKAALIDVVRATSAEVPALLDALVRQGIADEGRSGAFGVSMGGFIVYAAVTKEPRLAAAVALLGSPNWWMRPSSESPHRNLDAFGRVRLLSLTAGRDEAVPPVYAAAFHERLARRFDDHAERFRHLDYPASEHFMDPADWESAMGASCDWFRRHLHPAQRPPPCR